MSKIRTLLYQRARLAAALLTLTIIGPLAMKAGAQTSFIPQGYNDHKNMEEQLGIKSLRPGKNGNGPQKGKGYEDALANDMMPTLPDVLKMKDGTKVTTKEQWVARRAEIVEDFEREVYGRIPRETPKITWEVSEPVKEQNREWHSNAHPHALIRTRRQSAFPQITVDLRAHTVPANATGPVAHYH